MLRAISLTFLSATVLAVWPTTARAEAPSPDASASSATPAPDASAPATPAVAPPAPPSGSAGIELTSLGLMRKKGLISAEEYDSALKDLRESEGNHAPDSNTIVASKWATTFYGFVEMDAIMDSTQSLVETSGNTLIARPNTYASNNGRAQFSVRNSRFGFRLKAPETDGIRTSAQLEMDFLGTQLPVGAGQPYFGSEAALYTNPTLRARHLNLKVETPVVDFLFGQYWQLLGWQSAYHPNTVEIQGVPGELYGRTPQLRISKTIKTAPVTVELALAALRPPQRDSMTPAGQGGLRIALNDWTGLQTNGATGTNVSPASIAFTGDVRRIKLPAFAAGATDSTAATGATFAVDAFLPILPASKAKMDNALSLSGEFASGKGASDAYTSLTGGITFPALPNPAMTMPAPTYTQNIDNGSATFTTDGVLHLVQWTSYLIGLQYYLPGLGGHVWVSGNYSHLSSNNTISLGDPTKTLASQTWFDGNLFADISASVRLGIEYARFNNKYNDGVHATNDRGQFSAFYLF